MTERGRIFITGATGFVGSALVAKASAAGFEVHALARPNSPREHLSGLDIHWHEGDLLGEASLDRALRCASGDDTSVVHAAAIISYRSKEAGLSREINVRGTRNVLDACLRNRPRRLLFVSSVVAVGVAQDEDAALDETATFDAGRLAAAYVATKREAEEAVLAARDELDVVVVNPGAIFGPSPRRTNTMRLLSSIASSRFPVPAAPGSLAVVGVEDVADGILAALDRGVRGRRYLLTESNWRMTDLLAEVYAALGMSRRPLALGRGSWGVLVRCASLVDRVRTLEVTTPVALRLLGEHFRFDSSRARRELGWSPRPFREVLDETLRWMGEKGLLATRA